MNKVMTMPSAEEKPFTISLFVIVGLTVFVHHRYLRCYTIEELQESLERVNLEIEIWRLKYNYLILTIKNHPTISNNSVLVSLLQSSLKGQGPGKEYERTRRSVYSSTQELWNYLHHQLTSVLFEKITLEQRNRIVEEVTKRKRWILSLQERLPTLDCHDQWRQLETARVSDLVQRRISHLQSPPDCRKVKKVVCKHNYSGVGCNIHHLAHCLLIGYGLNRTTYIFHLRSARHWAEMFHPLARTCKLAHLRFVRYITANQSNDTSIFQPFGIKRISADPYAWWLGQFLKYIFNQLRRPEVIEETLARINFSLPIVGIHIRRTDKIAEAAYHDISEYMTHVEEYYNTLELSRAVDERTVYVATDDVHVLQEAIRKYPQYTFYGDSSRAEAASKQHRLTTQGLSGILADVHVLAMCDYVVCTFSSNVGRMAYELMQTKRTDAVNRFTSLDTPFYFTGIEARWRVAVMRNTRIPFEIGDLIDFAPKNAVVLRTNITARLPFYKTDEYVFEYPFPEYKEVPLHVNNYNTVV